ncbi:Hypothetical protein FKW44_002260, partial [Caligus rogercresseyi]
LLFARPIQTRLDGLLPVCKRSQKKESATKSILHLQTFEYDATDEVDQSGSLELSWNPWNYSVESEV